MAAVLDLQIRAGAIPPGIENRRGENVAGVEDVSDQKLAVIGSRAAGEIGDLRLVRIPYNPLDSRHPGQFVRRALGVAAGDQNPGMGIFAVHAADGGARIAIGFGSDGACIQDDQIGVLARFGFGQTAFGELGFERGAIGLRSPATEILDKKLVIPRPA